MAAESAVVSPAQTLMATFYHHQVWVTDAELQDPALFREAKNRLGRLIVGHQKFFERQQLEARDAFVVAASRNGAEGCRKLIERLRPMGAKALLAKIAKEGPLCVEKFVEEYQQRHFVPTEDFHPAGGEAAKAALLAAAAEGDVFGAGEEAEE